MSVTFDAPPSPQLNLRNAKVSLRACDPREILPEGDTSKVLKLWDTLRSLAVEAAQAPCPSFFAFRESCFYFATIQLSHKDQEDYSSVYPQVSLVARPYSRARFICNSCSMTSRMRTWTDIY